MRGEKEDKRGQEDKIKETIKNKERIERTERRQERGAFLLSLTKII